MRCKPLCRKGYGIKNTDCPELVQPVQSGGGGNRTRVSVSVSDDTKELTQLNAELTAVGQRTQDVNGQSLAVTGPQDVDPAIDYIQRAWPFLPPHVRDALFTLIDAALLQQQSKGEQS